MDETTPVAPVLETPVEETHEEVAAAPAPEAVVEIEAAPETPVVPAAEEETTV